MSQATVTPNPIAPSAPLRPQKSFVATWLFAWLLGGFGADRFYLGKIGTAIIKLVTFGGLGVWALIDLILVLVGKTTDKQGQPLAGYDQKKLVAWIVTGIFVIGGGISGGVIAATTLATVAAVTQPAIQELEDAAAAPAEEAPAADAAAEATDVVAWADDKYGTFEVASQTGTGDTVITLPAGSAAGLVRATHQGAANFSVQVLDAQNQPTLDLLVNTIGAYTGITAYGLNGDLGSAGVSLQITADGPWTIDVGPISYSAELSDAGTGDDVFLYAGEAATTTFTYEGAGNFTVIEYTDGGIGMGLLVNEIGAYTGTVPLSGGPSIVRVSAVGGWTAAQG